MRTSGDGGFGEGKGDEGVFRVDDGRTYDLVPLIRKGNMEMSRGGRWKWEVSYVMRINLFLFDAAGTRGSLVIL